MLHDYIWMSVGVEFFVAGYLNYTEAKAVAGCTVSQWLPKNFRCWLQADIQSHEIEVCFTPESGHS